MNRVSSSGQNGSNNRMIFERLHQLSSSNEDINSQSFASRHLARILSYIVSRSLIYRSLYVARAVHALQQVRTWKLRSRSGTGEGEVRCWKDAETEIIRQRSECVGTPVLIVRKKIAPSKSTSQQLPDSPKEGKKLSIIS